MELHYDKKNPPVTALVHNGSCVPFHENLRKTLDLLERDGLYFLLEGLSPYTSDWWELQGQQSYFYESHSCPTNWLRGVVLLCEDGNTDPHGALRFVESVWMTCEYERYRDAQQALTIKDQGGFDEYLKELFPQLRGDQE